MLDSNFDKRRLWQNSFPVKFAKFLRTPILKYICGRLLLNVINKETPTQVLFCEFCEFFKSICFVEHLRTAGSETLVSGSLFNKVASLTTWRLVALLERDSSTGISLWILLNFFGSFFAEHFLATTSQMFVFRLADLWGLQPKINLFGGAMVT